MPCPINPDAPMNPIAAMCACSVAMMKRIVRGAGGAGCAKENGAERRRSP
jgi:hypothetical protein